MILPRDPRVSISGLVMNALAQLVVGVRPPCMLNMDVAINYKLQVLGGGGGGSRNKENNFLEN